MLPRAEILLAPTWNCNLRCTYCFVFENSIDQPIGNMTPDTARSVVDSLVLALAGFKKICIHFYGGEPLLNLPAMEAIVERAQKFHPGKFTFSITTNGTVLSTRVIQLLKIGKFSITLSIDGPANIHDASRKTITGQPTHAKVIEFLHTVRQETECRIMGSSVVRSGWSLSKASSYLNSIGVDAHKAQAVRAQNDKPFALSPAEKMVYHRDLELIGQQVTEELADYKPQKDSRFTKGLLQFLLKVPSELFCGAGKSIFGITPTGDILPCILLDSEEYILGHISDPEYSWVKAGGDWCKTQANHRSECQECEALFLCGGGCQAMLSVCALDECQITRKEFEVTKKIFDHFESDLDPLIHLTGINWE